MEKNLHPLQVVSKEFPDIFFIRGERNGKYPFSNSIIFRDYLIDTGCSSNIIKLIKRKIPISNVILSHWHEDHISGNKYFNNVKFHSHTLDKPIIEDINHLIDNYDVLGTNLERKFRQLLESYGLQNTHIDQTLNDGDILKIGNMYKLKVLHTPGHSAGHLSFIELTSKIAFIADIDLSSFGPWYGCLDSNLMQFEDTIDRLKNLDIKIAVTSHKGILEGSKKIKNSLNDYKLKIQEREEKILTYFHEGKPITPKNLSGKNIIYKSYEIFKDYFLIAEKVMITKHFEKFQKIGKITNQDGGFVLS